MERPSTSPSRSAAARFNAAGRLSAYGRELVDVSSGEVVKKVCAGRCDPGKVSTAHGGVALLVGCNDRLLRVLDPASGAVSFVPDWVNHPTNCSFTLGRAASTGGECKLLRNRTDGARQVCSVLTLGGDGVTGGSFPPQNVYTGRRHVAVAKEKNPQILQYAITSVLTSVLLFFLHFFHFLSHTPWT